MSGKLVRRIENINDSKIQIEKAELQRGIYFYELKNNSGKIGFGKMVVE